MGRLCAARIGSLGGRLVVKEVDAAAEDEARPDSPLSIMMVTP